MIGTMQAKLRAGAKQWLSRSAARRFVRQQDGAAAVEFALVVAPFMALLFACLQTAIIFFAGQVLETAASDSARLIMTGQAQNSGYSQAQFKAAVCTKIYGLFDCANGLFVDVKTYTNFSSADTSKPITNDVANTSTTYTPGGPGDIVVVRLMYQWPMYVSLFGLDLADNGSNRLLMATVAFRNEPYQ